MNAFKPPRVILVEPRYQINVGAVARACKNFGCSELFLVRPKTRIGFTARIFAKHAEEVLAKAKTFNSISEAARGCSIVVGTTGAARRYNDRLKKIISPRHAARLCKGRKAALVFGSEATGLSAADIQACDLVASIPANPQHPILNLSHAAAVMLYEFWLAQRIPAPQVTEAPETKKRLLEEKFAAALSAANKTKQTGARVRDKEKVVRAFKNLLHRSRVEDDEAQALLAALTKMEKCGKKLSTC
ncbi:MAG: RNA methyltransferase [Candidatus Micrarchaeia archaeon]